LIETHTLEFDTSGENEILNITRDVQNVLVDSKCDGDGNVLLFLQSTTAGLTIMEDEEGLFEDFPRTMERVAPKRAEYKHEQAWHDGNGHSHMRSAIVGTSLTIPFSKKKNGLLLGQWQQVVLAEFDVRPRKRSLIVQIQW